MKENIEIVQILYEIASSIGNDLDLKNMLSQSLIQILKKLNCIAACIYFETDPDPEKITPFFSIPKSTNILPEYNSVARTLSSIARDKKSFPLPFESSVNGTNYYIYDLADMGYSVLFKNDKRLNPVIYKSLKSIFHKLGIACRTCIQNEALQNDRNLLKKANLDSVIVLSQTIEAKDPYTRGHCLRVRNYSKAIAEKFHLPRENRIQLEFAGILHDIGKIGIAGAILNKPGKLNEAERIEIEKHPQIGANIIKNIEFFKPILPIILHHHEHYDGNGYPKKFSGEQIPFLSRILSVADVFDAISSDRPYRKAFQLEKCLSIVNEMSGTQLDPEIVEVFLSNKLYAINQNEEQQIDFDF